MLVEGSELEPCDIELWVSDAQPFYDHLLALEAEISQNRTLGPLLRATPGHAAKWDIDGLDRWVGNTMQHCAYLDDLIYR